MGVLLLIGVIVGIALISNIKIGGPDTRSDQQKWVDDFEMDSYDDEQFLGRF